MPRKGVAGSMRATNWRQWIRRTAMLLTIGAVGLLEAYSLPRYGIEWMLAAIAGTVFLAGYWIRISWD